MNTLSSNVRTINVDGAALLEELKKSGWEIDNNDSLPDLTDWRVIEGGFNFHTTPGSALYNIMKSRGGDPLIITLNPEAWFGDWKIAILATTIDYGIVLISEEAPKVYYKESGIVLDSLKSDLQKIIDKIIETENESKEDSETNCDSEQDLDEILNQFNLQ